MIGEIRRVGLLVGSRRERKRRRADADEDGDEPGTLALGEEQAAARTGNSLGTGLRSSFPSAGASHEFTGLPPRSRTPKYPFRAATVTPGRLTLTSIVRNRPS